LPLEEKRTAPVSLENFSVSEAWNSLHDKVRRGEKGRGKRETKEEERC